MKHTLPYSTPEGYFEQLEGRLTSRIGPRRLPAIAAAASLAILLGIGGFAIGRYQNVKGEALTGEDAVIEYLIDTGAPLAYFEDSL